MSEFERLYEAVKVLADYTGTDAEEWGHPTTPHGEDETVFCYDGESEQADWQVWSPTMSQGFVLTYTWGWYEQRGDADDLEALARLVRAMDVAGVALNDVLTVHESS